jgi:predicted aldo/keto reductase-like oxidoreductase
MANARNSPFLACLPEAFGKPVARLGLASRPATALTPDDVLYAIDRGVGFLNWPGWAEGPEGADAVSTAVASLGSRREEVVVCVQFGAHTAQEVEVELSAVLCELRTDYVDVVTLYYVETEEEWQQISRSGGALDVLMAAKRDGVVRRIGITSHQRPLAAKVASTGLIDVLMIRYNAAHRGAETEIFPLARRLGMPVVAYTALRWGALLQPTPSDPPSFVPPEAPLWYRFALQEAAVSVVLAAPHTRDELEFDLEVLSASEPLPPDQLDLLRTHGERVRRHAGQFP